MSYYLDNPLSFELHSYESSDSIRGDRKVKFEETTTPAFRIDINPLNNRSNISRQSKSSSLSPKKLTNISNSFLKKNSFSVSMSPKRGKSQISIYSNKNSPNKIIKRGNENFIDYLDSSDKDELNLLGLKKYQQDKAEKDEMYIITSDFGLCFKEIRKMIKKKKYTKSFKFIKYFESNFQRDFDLESEIRIRRRICTLSNKLCKHKYFKLKSYSNKLSNINFLLETNLESFEKWSKFLNIYLSKKYSSYSNVINLDNLHYLTSTDEDRDYDNEDDVRYKEPITPLLFRVPKGYNYDNSLDQTPVYIQTKNEIFPNNASFARIDDDYEMKRKIRKSSIETIKRKRKNTNDEFYDDFWDMIRDYDETKLKNLNVNFEVNEYVSNILELLFQFSLYYIGRGNYKIGYKYAFCLNKHTDYFKDSINPDILSIIIKAKLHYAIFLMHFKIMNKSQQILEETLIISQKELNIRLNLSSFIENPIKKKENETRTKACSRLMMMILITLASNYKFHLKFIQYIDTLTLAYSLSHYLLQSDAIYFFIKNMYSTEIKKYQQYLIDIGEMESSIRFFLKDDFEFKQKLIKKEQNPDILQEINKKLYTKFNYKNINMSNYILKRKTIESPIFIRKNYSTNNNAKSNIKKILINKNNFNINSINTDNHKTQANLSEKIQDSSLTYSFFNDNSSDSENSLQISDSPLLSIHSLRMKKMKLIKKKNIKLLGRFDKEFNEDYKTKVLTTSEYFRKYEDCKEDENKKLNNKKNIDEQNLINEKLREVNLENEKKFIKKINKHFENEYHSDLYLSMGKAIFGQSSTQFTEEQVNLLKEKDLDYFMDKIINENLEKKYVSRKFSQINKNYLNHLKKEDFDKKEFSFCKKMLLMKANENTTEINSHKDIYKNPLIFKKKCQREQEDMENKIESQNKVHNKTENEKTNINLSKKKMEFKTKNPLYTYFSEIMLKHRKTLNLENAAERILENRENIKKTVKKIQEKIKKNEISKNNENMYESIARLQSEISYPNMNVYEIYEKLLKTNPNLFNNIEPQKHQKLDISKKSINMADSIKLINNNEKEIEFINKDKKRVSDILRLKETELSSKKESKDKNNLIHLMKCDSLSNLKKKNSSFEENKYNSLFIMSKRKSEMQNKKTEKENKNKEIEEIKKIKSFETAKIGIQLWSEQLLNEKKKTEKDYNSLIVKKPKEKEEKKLKITYKKTELKDLGRSTAYLSLKKVENNQVPITSFAELVTRTVNMIRRKKNLINIGKKNLHN